MDASLVSVAKNVKKILSHNPTLIQKKGVKNTHWFAGKERHRKAAPFRSI